MIKSQRIKIVFIILGIALITGSSYAAWRMNKESKTPVLGIDQYLTAEDVYNTCHAPGSCGRKLGCEGEVVKVKGYIDYRNVFDKKYYPQLPYEKFTIRDKKGNSLEVWALSDDNNQIFFKIYSSKTSPTKMAFIKGIIIGFDMPVMGACHRGIRVTIEQEKDLYFQ